MNKVKGFTLVEVLMGLMIMAIVGSVVTTSWVQGQKVLVSLQAKQDSLIRLSFKLEQISKDLLNAPQLVLLDSNKFYFRDTMGIHVFERRQNLLMLTKNGIRDTVLFDVSEMYLHTVCQSNFVDAVHIQTDKRQLELKKNYGADIYVNYCG